MIGVDQYGIWMRAGMPPTWKRDLLFLDKIYLIPNDFVIDRVRAVAQWQSHHEFLDELDYLIETPYFLTAEFPARWSDAEAIMPLIARHLVAAWQDTEDPRANVEPRELRAARVATTRLMACCFQEEGKEAVVIGDSSTLSGAVGAVPATLINLATRRVLVPDDSVPWERIFELKEDAGLQARARKLRLWAQEIAKPGMTIELADEYVADAISDYEAYMKMHDLKFRSGMLKSVIVGTAELIEELVKMNFSKIATRFVSIGSVKANVLDSEMKAPGRALSLVTELNRRLG